MAVSRKTGIDAPLVRAKPPITASTGRERVQRQYPPADHTLAPMDYVVRKLDGLQVGFVERTVGRVVRVWVPVGARVSVPSSGRSGAGEVVADRGTAGMVRWGSTGGQVLVPWSLMRAARPLDPVPHWARVSWDGAQQDVAASQLEVFGRASEDVAFFPPPRWPTFDEPKGGIRIDDGSGWRDIDIIPANPDGSPNYAVFADGRQRTIDTRAFDRAGFDFPIPGAAPAPVINARKGGGGLGVALGSLGLLGLFIGLK